LTVFLGKFEKPPIEATDKSKKPDKADEVKPLNPIDVALGAPAPEKPKKDKDKAKGKDKKNSPTPAYVFAAIFAALYIVGRILEPWLIRSEFRKRLSGERVPGLEAPSVK
jgi:hypothetical protein